MLAAWQAWRQWRLAASKKIINRRNAAYQ